MRRFVILLLVTCLWTTLPAQQARTPYSGSSPLVVPAAAFDADAQSSEYYFTFGGGYLYPQGIGGCFEAPVYLPESLEIFRLRAMLFDNTPEDFTISLVRKENMNTFVAQTLASVTTSGQSTQIAVLQDDTILNPAISRDYSYFITGCWTSVSSSQRLYAVEVHYAAASVPLGDFVWRDDNGNGIQDGGEIGVPDVPVALYDVGGALLDLTQTDNSGFYQFSGFAPDQTYRLRFWPPVGFSLTLQDQGSNDAFDSDADPLTGETPPITMDPAEFGFWDAGVVPNCPGPDEAVYISDVGRTSDGNNYPLITFLDPNQPPTVTGYNVYRSSDASLPPGNWPLVASDIVDMDQGLANAQWIDSSGDISPTGIWYYDIAAYSNRCLVEGPR
jgi:hypothetical protein